MASAPVKPVALATTATTATPATTPTVLDNWIALFKAHERFLIIVLTCALAFHFYGAALTAWVNHDKASANHRGTKISSTHSAERATGSAGCSASGRNDCQQCCACEVHSAAGSTNEGSANR